jgi:hypothetical protein
MTASPTAAPGPDPGIYITTTQMYQELRQVHDEVKGIRSDLRTLMEDRADHEARIRALERRVWTASGMATVLGALGGVLAQILIR